MTSISVSGTLKLPKRFCCVREIFTAAGALDANAVQSDDDH